MMTRPAQFYLIPFIYLCVALSFPIQVMLLYGHHWTELEAIIGKITYLNWMVMFSFLLGSYLYFKASKKILYFGPFLIATVVLNNYLVGKFAGDYSLLQTSVASFALIFSFLPLMLPSSRLLLKNPGRRWWMRSKRTLMRTPVTVNPFVGDMISAHTFDVSKTGLFLNLDENKNSNLPKIGEKLRLIIQTHPMKKIRVEAIVVRYAEEEQGRYPKGMGLKFLKVDKDQQKSFKAFVESKGRSH